MVGLTESRPLLREARDPLLSGDMSAPDPIADQAVALASVTGTGSRTTDEAVGELASAGDHDALIAARADLLGRIQQRSDDYAATGGLTLVNKALAVVGWVDPSSWKHRRRP
jgi:hypothetical protein